MVGEGVPLETNLLREAANGSRVAQVQMAYMALDARDRGVVRSEEGLIFAETCARLAAAAGGREENGVLFDVLLLRAAVWTDLRNVSHARFYEKEARQVLSLVYPDQHLAVEAAPAGHDAMICQLAAASRGEWSAFRSLFDLAANMFLANIGTPLDALTVAELYARLGVAAGDRFQARNLAGVLLARARFEREAGDATFAASIDAEAAAVMASLAAAGDQEVATWIALGARGPALTGLAIASHTAPTILQHIEPVGAC